MIISPMVCGDTSPLLKGTFLDDSDTPISLIGLGPSAFALHIYNVNTGVPKVGQGTWAVIDANNGVAQYAWAAADTSTVGYYLVSVVITTGNGPQHSDAQQLQIVAAP